MEYEKPDLVLLTVTVNAVQQTFAGKCRPTQIEGFLFGTAKRL